VLLLNELNMIAISHVYGNVCMRVSDRGENICFEKGWGDRSIQR